MAYRFNQKNEHFLADATSDNETVSTDEIAPSNLHTDMEAPVAKTEVEKKQRDLMSRLNVIIVLSVLLIAVLCYCYYYDINYINIGSVVLLLMDLIQISWYVYRLLN